jgi:hypothetical protein
MKRSPLTRKRSDPTSKASVAWKRVKAGKKKARPLGLSLRMVPKLKRDLQVLVNARIRARDARCEVFHSKFYDEKFGECKGIFNASHIFARQGYPSLRFDPDNIITKCRYHHKHWWHSKTAESWNWIEDHLGRQKFHALRLKARDTYIDWDRNPAWLHHLITILKTRPDQYESEYRRITNQP